jgi:hypothetical protein
MPPNDPTQTTPTGGKVGGNIPAVHTLKSDAAYAMNRQNVTVVDIARQDHQVRARDAQVYNVPQKPNWPKRILITVSVLLVLSGIGIGGYLGYRWYTKVPEPVKPSAFAPIIEANHTTEYELSANNTEALEEHIAEARNDRLPAGQIRYMPLMLTRSGQEFAEPATANDFIGLAALHPPQALKDALTGKWSMYTVYGETKGDTAWLFGINTNAVDRTRSAIQEWERSIRQDFSRITGISAVAAPATSTKTVPGITITRWIILGTKGDDVLTLQTFLKDIGNLPAAYTPSTTMDSASVEALKKYQCDKKLVCGGTANDGYGATGPKTRTALLEAVTITDNTANTNTVGGFAPDTIENVEVRVLRDSATSPGLYSYAIFNNNLLVITTSPDALRVMLQLLRVKRINL